MKILICGECPHPLTTVAQDLNRLRSEQMRLEPLLRPDVSASTVSVVSPDDKQQPPDALVADFF
jgi:hypothetical protein